MNCLTAFVIKLKYILSLFQPRVRAIILGKWENEAREVQTQRPSGLQSDLLKNMDKI